MPPKRILSTRPTRANPTGKEVSNIKPLTLTKSQKGRKREEKCQEKVVDKTFHVVTPSKKSPILVETVEEDDDDDEFIMPGKKAKKDTTKVKTKVTKKKTKKVPTVGTKHAKKIANVSKEVSPLQSKKAAKAKKIIAVMNVKSGLAKICKTAKQAKDFITEMNAVGLAEYLETFIFDNEEDYVNTSEAYKKKGGTDAGTPISTKTAGILGAGSIPVSPTKQAHPLSQAVSEQYARLNKPAVASNKLAAHLQQTLSGLNGTSLKLLLFPETVCVTDDEKYQVFAIDVVENKTGNTLWTHKPDAWSKLFQLDEELAVEDGGHNIDPFFYSLQATCPRSVPKGPNVRKQLVTKNGKTVDFQLLWGMIKCISDTQAKLELELAKFTILANDKDIQQAYLVAVQNMGTNFPALLEQLRPFEQSKTKTGEYWTKLASTSGFPIKIVHHKSMDEVFQDDVINTAVSFIWEAGGLSTSMWSGEMNMFAYGRT